MKKVLDALLALTKTLPGVHHLGMSLACGCWHFHINVDNDDAIRAFEEALSLPPASPLENEATRWMRTSGVIGNTSILVTGPHTDILPAREVDAVAIAAALDQADGLLAGRVVLDISPELAARLESDDQLDRAVNAALDAAGAP